MKKDIHPKYNDKITANCVACGSEFTFGAVVDEIRVENCMNCHPIYTGKKTMVDSAGRVDRFKTRQAKASVQAPVETTETEEKPSDKVEETAEVVA